MPEPWDPKSEATVRALSPLGEIPKPATDRIVLVISREAFAQDDDLVASYTLRAMLFHPVPNEETKGFNPEGRIPQWFCEEGLEQVFDKIATKIVSLTLYGSYRGIRPLILLRGEGFTEYSEWAIKQRVSEAWITQRDQADHENTLPPQDLQQNTIVDPLRANIPAPDWGQDRLESMWSPNENGKIPFVP